MTDQDNSNSNSENPEIEVVNEYTIVENFLRQYKKFKLGMLDPNVGVLTVREQQALLISMTQQTSMMQAFIGRCAAILETRAREEFGTLDEVIECLTNFHGVMYEVIFSLAFPFTALTPDQKAMIRKAYEARKEQMESEKEKGSEDPFANLDFDLPNIDQFKPPHS